MRKGTTQSAESKAKISQGMRGRGKSQETREKMSLARTVYWANKRREIKFKRELMEELTRPLVVEPEAPAIAPPKGNEFR